MIRFLTHAVWIIACVLLLGLAAERNESLRVMRRDLHISQADPMENAPPLVAFTTVAMGGFRGILADWLWIRAAGLQEEGKYFELVQLADWITKLEPRFTSVWAYQAWNLSYNISVLFDKPEDRWRWVRNGLELLRDEGLKYNPGDARLLYELGWIFQHKIAGNSDQFHMYYKKQWADEMSKLFDGPHPVAKDADAAKRLREIFKMDIGTMQSIDDSFGPLDWRLPQAHALYWAVLSRRIATGFDAVSAERMVFQSMADALQQGLLFSVPSENIFIPSPNLELLPRVRKAFEDAIASQPNQATFKTAHENFLASAIVLLFSYHRETDARSLFDELRQRYPEAAGDDDFESYVSKTFADNLENLTGKEAVGVIEGALFQSLFWEAYGDRERAAGYAELAKLTWDKYTALLTKPSTKERSGLPPLADIRLAALARLKEQNPDNAAVHALK